MNRLTMREQNEQLAWQKTQSFRNHVLGALALIVYGILVRFL